MTAERTKPIAPDLESFPEVGIVMTHMQWATGAAAVSAYLHIQEFTGGKPEEENLPKDEKNRRTIILDTDANTAFEIAIRKAPFISRGVDAEGGKEKQADKLGVAMPQAIGLYGSGDKKISYTVDVIEGTTAAAHGRPGAISIVGISTDQGITKIPDYKSRPEEMDYFRKLFAPAAFKKDLAIEKSAQENLKAIMRSAQIPASAITVVAMDRKCNGAIIHQAQELGAKVELISAGDLAWCLKAINSDPQNPTIMLGRGGAPEGSIAAIATRAMGATGQLQTIEEDEKDLEEVTGKVWTADEFVPGAREHSMVIYSAITQNTHFGHSAVKPLVGAPNLYLVETMVIKSSGFHKGSTVVNFEKQ